MTLRPLNSYARVVREHLPARAFAPVPSRLAWLTLHVALVIAGTLALARGIGGWWAAPLWSLLIGHSFAGCAFVGHETMHGAVVRGKRARLAIGWLSFLPFAMSPRLWVAWHNKTHHAHTMSSTRDPDAFPTLTAYRNSKLLRLADRFTFAAHRPVGFLTLLFGFTGQSAQMMWRWSKTSDAMTPTERRWAIVETVAGWAVWLTLLAWLGPAKWLFAYVLPLLVGNAIVISYILTNHSLSPLTDVNDPLVNSLSVTVPSLFMRLHLNFGLHVEHHLFPAMSSAYAPLVRDQLVARWPERYQSLPLMTAMVRLATTPRVYGTATTLIDPRDGAEAATIQPLEIETRVEPPLAPEAVPALAATS